MNKEKTLVFNEPDDAHITKPQINELVELIDKFCLDMVDNGH
ncbi:MAG: hypothetical protein ACUZ8O_05270 [Candidatus Anammoxibacter sp.]